MGMDIDAKLVVGVRLSEIDQAGIGLDWVLEDENDLEGDYRVFFVHEDTTDEHRIFGICVADSQYWSATQIDAIETLAGISEAAQTFRKELHVEPMLFIMPHMDT